jgi:hypothetical protein
VTLSKQNNGRLHNSTGIAIVVAHSLDSSSKNSPSPSSEQQVCVAGGNSKVEYTYGWYSTNAGNKWHARVISR